MSFADDCDPEVTLTPLGTLLNELATTAADLAARAEAGDVIGPGDGFGLDLQVARIRRMISDELQRSQPAFTPATDKAAQLAMGERHHARADRLEAEVPGLLDDTEPMTSAARDNRPTEAA